ncbi:MAG: DUF523 domain-containing protein [Saccharospirillaceae bacterium]|nr:DUF523 domain-containing protein [Pseudomonadales bacterium]NRB78828.1 DUF523 domain-containing protein [Saccharospirillaceae bacterium]
MQHKILVSACLMGEEVRYDGKHNLVEHITLNKLKTQNRLILVCPEMLGGLPTPREPAEIITTSKTIRVKTEQKIDVTAQFIEGANKTLQICLDNKIDIALMAAKSPSCGNIETYNGEFNRTLIKQAGITAQLLQKNGIKVFNQNQLNEFFKYLEQTN